jgi:peptidoglycan/xylan/chitin deacetylase (PgdA/CDA1 family)
MNATFYLTTGFLNGGLMYNDMVLESVRRMAVGEVDLGWLGLGSMPVSDLASRNALISALIKAVKYLDGPQRRAACEQVASLAIDPLPTDVMMSADQVASLRNAGMAVGGHTVDHPILTRIPDDEAWAQILKNRDELAAITGERPRLFAYPNGKPNGDYEARHIHMVSHAGYTSAVSTGAGAATPTTDRFQMPRLSPWDKSETMFVARVLRMARAGDKGQSETVDYPASQG